MTCLPKPYIHIAWSVCFASAPTAGICDEETDAVSGQSAAEPNLTIDTTSSTEVSLISDREWKKSTKVWIARAMVSEAGWDEKTDHIAIAYVLYRRWVRAKKKYPKFKMSAVVAKYCAGFGKTVYSARQKWVRNLNEDGTRPKGWPNDIAWMDYKDRWLAVLETAENWRQGVYPDPCRRLSRYWGGPMDKPSKRMIRMDCGKTKNYFYTVRTLLPEAGINRSDSK